MNDVAQADALAVTMHPLQRAGAWAVMELAGQSDGARVTSADLDAVAGRLTADVCAAATAAKEDAAYDWWKVLFALFPNSKATHSKRPRERRLLEPDIAALFAPDQVVGGGRTWPCTFCSRPAGTVWTKSALPLFDTNKALNTLPPGVAGWPVCRGCRVAAWALPYGAWVTAGSVTVMSCEEEAAEQRFVSRNVARARRILQAGFGAQPAGARPEREAVAALWQVAGQVPRAATLWHFKNDNQEPWLRVTRTRRAASRFLALVQGNEPLRRAWKLLVRELTRFDGEGRRTTDGRAEAARLLFEAEDGQGRTLLMQLYRLLLLPRERAWALEERAVLTRLAFDYAKEVLGVSVAGYQQPVAELLADWIEHGSGSPRGRLAEYRTVALSDYKLGQLLVRAQFRLALDGRPVAAGPQEWQPLITQRPRAWEQRMLLAAGVVQLLQERGVPIGERPDSEDQAGADLEADPDEQLFSPYDDDQEAM
ncbi:hypothetical protein [Streptomyces sp. 891-h]|uniref:hypothetical protein n=1 Tax=Streptomyces sp. 891-h TaxID=2720714 RepID=UPI001FAA9FC3|nr:hypothetical protein [Streptomyces sp. 891-h]UNZ21341.1 hypothetical protein HC362_34090 [Streptomyces sp. 891-h]